MIARRACTPLLALTLAASACESTADTDDIVALRPGGGGGILTDTSAIGDWTLTHLDRRTSIDFKGTVLIRICLSPKFFHRCIKAIKIVDGLLVGEDEQGTYSGDDLLGSRWDLAFDTGALDSAASVRLVGREVVAVPGGGALELVDFRTDRATVTGPLANTLPPGTGPIPLCAPDPARGWTTHAALLRDVVYDTDGRFVARPDTLRISCTSGAIGRATTLGYHPEELGLDGFTALVRALIADYCGTGESQAAPADAFALADVWKIHGASAPLREARWGSEGALCLDQPRDPQLDADAVRDACGIPKCDGGPLGSAGELALTSLPD
jgi:hypothetical protein